MKYYFGLFLFTIFISCQENRKIEEKNEPNIEEKKTIDVLLVGTFHFENFNPENNSDIVQKQVSDVLTEENQAELKKISQRIIDFKPNKIFVEYSFKNQTKLDSLFNSFPKNADFKNQKRDELYQIGFRVAKKLNHENLYAIDTRTSFPYDSLLKQMKKAKQFDLIHKDELELKQLEETANELFSSNKSLSEILFFYNQSEYRKSDVNWYLSLANQGGEIDNFVGSHLASEWYKRNLQMYSIIQKSIERGDKRIMILAGSSHIAMFKDFIDYNPDWKTVELKNIMNK